MDWSRPYSRVWRIVETGHIVPETSPELQPFVKCYTELSVLEGCLLREFWIIIPPQGRKTFLSHLHDTHPGITRMKHLTRVYIWWPGLDKEIEHTVKNCNIWQMNRVSQPENIVHSWECPSTSWTTRTRVHVDHAWPFLGKYYYILVVILLVDRSWHMLTLPLPQAPSMYYVKCFLLMLHLNNWSLTMVLPSQVMSFESSWKRMVFIILSLLHTTHVLID